VGYYEGRDAVSFFGLQDLAGNVMEWCQDWYNESAYINHNYAISPEGPASGEARVVRGGSWQSDAIDCNTRVRKEFLPTVSHETIGFRTVISAEPFLTMWRTQ
jgi:formylglycine-generating enzyme required for sulfatase activity